jgi:hypothetical protein
MALFLGGLHTHRTYETTKQSWGFSETPLLWLHIVKHKNSADLLLTVPLCTDGLFGSFLRHAHGWLSHTEHSKVIVNAYYLLALVASLVK